MLRHYSGPLTVGVIARPKILPRYSLKLLHSILGLVLILTVVPLYAQAQGCDLLKRGRGFLESVTKKRGSFDGDATVLSVGKVAAKLCDALKVVKPGWCSRRL